MITKEQSEKVLSLASNYVNHKSLYEYRKIIDKNALNEDEVIQGLLTAFVDYLDTITSDEFSLTGKISQHSNQRLKLLLREWTFRAIKHKERLAKHKPVYTELDTLNISKYEFKNYLDSLVGMVHNPQDAEDEESKA